MNKLKYLLPILLLFAILSCSKNDETQKIYCTGSFWW